MNWHQFVRRVARWAPVVLLFLATGCDKGPDRYQVSGKVTYAGQPIPSGEISFSPDSSKGNSGPGAVAPIKDGNYSTPPDIGIVGGPHVIRIMGFDGKAKGDVLEGTALFDKYQIQVDLPKEDSTKDFDVPKGGNKARRGAR